MKNLSMKLFLMVLAILLANSPAAAAPSAQTLLKNADRARGGGLPGIIWEIRLVSREGDKVSEEMRLEVRAVNDASVAETLDPAHFRGSKLLQVGRNMWLTRPGLAKPIPISPRQRLKGEAANGDIAATDYAGDYDAQPAGKDIVEGEPCQVLELTARHKRTTYDRIRYWITEKRGVGIKAEFYSLSGKLLKTARFKYDNSIPFEGRNIPFISKMIIRDGLIDAETTMDFGAVKVRTIAPAEFDLGQIQ